QFNLLIRERRRSFPSDGYQAKGPISAYHGHHQPGPVPRESRVFDIARARVRVVLDIPQMKNAAYANRLSPVDLGVERNRVLLSEPLQSLRSNPVSRGHSKHIAVDDEHRAAQGRTDADPASGDRLEDRLRVGRRAPDDTQNLTGRPFAR